jgi:hypothetical protein
MYVAMAEARVLDEHIVRLTEKREEVGGDWIRLGDRRPAG